MEVTTENAPERRGATKQAKNGQWKSKALAPASWMSTLLAGKLEGSSVLLEYRSGRQGAWMTCESLELQTVRGATAHESIAPLAGECWSLALEHRAELPGDRYDYRIKVVTIDDEGGVHCEESDPCEVPRDDGADVIGDEHAASNSATERMLSSMVVKLFSANIGIVRASAQLIREQTTGAAERMTADFETVRKVKEMAMTLIERERDMARAESEAAEVAELGETARSWITMMSESKLAKEGIQIPDVPKTRAGCATALRQSLTMFQVETITKRLPEQADLLMGLLANAAGMSDEQIEQLITEHLGNKSLELLMLVEEVFSSKFVPGPWAIWQRRVAERLIQGTSS